MIQNISHRRIWYDSYDQMETEMEARFAYTAYKRQAYIYNPNHIRDYFTRLGRNENQVIKNNLDIIKK
jgi:hypothetical protein